MDSKGLYKGVFLYDGSDEVVGEGRDGSYDRVTLGGFSDNNNKAPLDSNRDNSSGSDDFVPIAPKKALYGIRQGGGKPEQEANMEKGRKVVRQGI
jgi:hypothetical protein